MEENSVKVIHLKSLQESFLCNNMEKYKSLKVLILDTRGFHDIMSKAMKEAILTQLKGFEGILVLVCMLESAFFSHEYSQFVDMIYVACEKPIMLTDIINLNINGFIHEQEIDVIVQRLHQLVDGKELKQIKEIKKFFHKLVNVSSQDRESWKEEESRFFCKLAFQER